jgi:CRISPR-associated endonuclease/helicase Cas3
VYDEDSFNPKDRDIKELIFIPTILESADLAVKTFIDLEGSFVRDSTLVPVISSSLWHEDMPLSELEKFLVPMSLSTVYEVKPKEMLVIDGDKISKKSTEELWHRKKEDVLKHVLSSKFVTFIVEGDYDEELGLVMRHEKDF